MQTEIASGLGARRFLDESNETLPRFDVRGKRTLHACKAHRAGCDASEDPDLNVRQAQAFPRRQ
jgi:hypothetical protein